MRHTHHHQGLLEAVSAPGVTAISHHSAAHVHGLLAEAPALIHVIALRGHHPQPQYGVIAHHTRTLDGRDLGRVSSLPGVVVTRPATTVVMLAAYLSTHDLDDLVRRVLDGHCLPSTLCDAAVRRLTRGRRGPRRVLDSLDRVLGTPLGQLAAVNQ